MTGVTGNHKRIVVLAMAALAAAVFASDAFAQAPPPFPFFYNGTAKTADGASVPDGLTVFAIVGDYTSEPAEVINGEFRISLLALKAAITSTRILSSYSGTWKRTRRPPSPESVFRRSGHSI